MSKRILVFAVGLILILATAGCFDLFGVPGVAVSPDGSQIYFLASAGETNDQMGITSLSSISIDGGQPTAIMTGDKENLSSAFAVNPTNGDVAFVQTSKANGTQVMLYSGGSTRELVSGSAFGTLGIGTMMRYSPDGSRIALTMTQFPPGMSIEALENSDQPSAEELAGIHFVAFVINAADGSLTTISNPDTEAANTIAWSPDSGLLAYNAWVDSSGDGKISTMPSFDLQNLGTAPSDNSQIRIYDVGSGAVKSIDSQTIDYAQTFISNTEVAYVTLNFMTMMSGATTGAAAGASGPSVMAYDVASGASRVAYQGQGGSLVIGMTLSPDGSKIAWVELPSGGGVSAGGSSGSSPSHLYVGANFDASGGAVAEIPGETGFPDAPVWLPDGNSILISSTNIFSALVGQMTASFGGAAAAGGAETPTGALPTQKLLRVDLASKSVSTVYEGPMANSSFFASILSLATSGALDELGSGAPSS